MDISRGFDVLGEEGLCETDSEGITHGIDEHVGDAKGKCFPGKDKGAEGLASKGKVRPCCGGDIAAGGEVKEGDFGRVEGD